ncbi:MAG: hypothetical protein AABY10_00855 [Nanoarchaeota archaeon]
MNLDEYVEAREKVLGEDWKLSPPVLDIFLSICARREVRTANLKKSYNAYSERSIQCYLETLRDRGFIFNGEPARQGVNMPTSQGRELYETYERNLSENV